MPRSKLSIEERKRNKREKARLRQQRCREKKRQTLVALKTKQKQEEQASSATFFDNNLQPSSTTSNGLVPAASTRNHRFMNSSSPSPVPLCPTPIPIGGAGLASSTTQQVMGIPCFALALNHVNHANNGAAASLDGGGQHRQHGLLNVLPSSNPLPLHHQPHQHVIMLSPQRSTPPSIRLPTTTSCSTTNRVSVSPACVTMLNRQEDVRSCSKLPEEGGVPSCSSSSSLLQWNNKASETPRQGTPPPPLPLHTTITAPKTAQTPQQDEAGPATVTPTSGEKSTTPAPHPQFAVNALLSLCSSSSSSSLESLCSQEERQEQEQQNKKRRMVAHQPQKQQPAAPFLPVLSNLNQTPSSVLLQHRPYPAGISKNPSLPASTSTTTTGRTTSGIGITPNPGYGHNKKRPKQYHHVLHSNHSSSQSPFRRMSS